LARIVGYIPVPVVGGYLAFIGYFCLQAGVALCISKPMATLSDWALLLDAHNLMLAVPGLATGLLLLWTAKNATSGSTLPILMCALPACFYAFLYARGFATGFRNGDVFVEAREAGWVGKETGMVVTPQAVFGLLDLSKVQWWVMPKLLVTWGGMVAVVGFSSVLDVAAISMDMGEALDTDKELITVGASNMISGLFGGFTGSYIFSQTIFQFRTKVWSRWIGLLVAGSELVVFSIETDLLSMSPLFFFGATLIFIGFDLLVEWLWDVREKVSNTELLVLVSTFTLIHIVGIDFGVIAGIVLSIMEYTIGNAALADDFQFVKRVERRSRKVRSLERWRKIQQLCYSGNVVTFELRGVLYFGNCLQLLTKLMSTVGLKEQPYDFASAIPSPPPGRHALPSPGTPRIQPTSGLGRMGSFGFLPKFVVLDFHGVQSLDSSGVRAIAQFAQNCSKNKIKVLVGGASARVANLMHKGKVFEQPGKGTARLFESVSSALEDCEERMLETVHEEPTEDVVGGGAATPAIEKGDPHALYKILQHLLGEVVDGDRGDVITNFYKSVPLRPGAALFKEFGGNTGGAPTSPAGYTPSSDRSETFYVVLEGHIVHSKSENKRDTLSGRGGVVGYVDFFAERQRTFTASAGGEGAVVARFDRAGVDRMRQQEREVFAMLERYLLRVSVLELANVNDEL
ncbi:hypothetical protein TeGR_g4929, partial [Tetraparma gracilis]